VVSLPECSRCGECCTYIVYPLKVPPRWARSYRAFLEARGVEVVKLPGGWGEGAKEPKRCPHLTEDNLCDIYDHRPDICRLGKCPKK
jgi:Fe-S-cluster containining protein